MTRRLASTLFLIVVVGVVVAGITGAATNAGLESSETTVLEHGKVRFGGTTIQDGGGERVAVVPIRGSITNGSNDPAGGSTGSDDTVALIDEIAESGDFEGIVLELDTPGGGVLPSAEIADAVSRAREDHEMDVVAWMRNTAASGGYYVAARADSIVAAPDTVTGSIGVILQYYEVSELADRVGVEAITVKSGELKDMGSMFRELTREERGVLQGLIDEAYGGFVDTIVDGRDLAEGRVREIADGRIYTGRQAEELGLVDELGLRRAAYEEMGRLIGEDPDDLEVVTYRRSYSFAELLTASSNRALGAAADTRALGELVGGALTGRGLTPAPFGPAGGASGPGIQLEYRAVL